MIWERGDRGDYYIAIVAGVVHCEADGGAQEFRLGPSDALGTMDSAIYAPRWYRAVVDEDMVGLRVPSQTLLDAFEDHFPMALDLLSLLCQSILQFHKATFDPNATEAA